MIHDKLCANDFTAAYMLSETETVAVSWTADNGVMLRKFPRQHSEITVGALMAAASRFPAAGGVVLLVQKSLDDDGLKALAFAMGEHGYKHGDVSKALESGWLRFYGGPTPPIIIGNAYHVPESDYITTLTDSVMEMGAFLACYHAATGGPWFSTPGLSGVTTLRRSFDGGKTPRWQAPRPRGVPAISELKHTVPHDPTQVATWDMRWARLNAASAAKLPLGPLAPGRMLDFEERDEYGYVKVPERQLLAQPDGMPIWWGKVDPSDGGVWITTGHVDLCREMSIYPHILDSYTAPGGTLLRSWANGLRDALYWERETELLSVANRQTAGIMSKVLKSPLKDTYRQVVGMIATEGRSIHRPDWHDIVIGTEQFLALRRVYKVGCELDVWPVKIDTDAVTYRVTDAEVWELDARLGSGDRCGQMRLAEVPAA